MHRILQVPSPEEEEEEEVEQDGEQEGKDGRGCEFRGHSFQPLLFLTGMREQSRQTVVSNGRDVLEKRRRRQTKEHAKTLGMLESLRDDESFVEMTLANLEYSTNSNFNMNTNTNTNSVGALFKEIIDETAPYTTTTPWKLLLCCKRLRKKINQYSENLVLPNKKRALYKYLPWGTVLIVYMLYQLTSNQPSAVGPTKVGRTVTKSTLEDRFQNSLNDLPNEESSKRNTIYAPIVGDPLNVAAASPRDIVPTKQKINDDSLTMETLTDQEVQRSNSSTLARNDITTLKSPQNTVDGGGSWIDFGERIQKLKELKEKGIISNSSKSGPVSQFLAQQEQQTTEGKQITNIKPSVKEQDLNPI